ncbi:MAG: hypothetical protein WCG85_24500 [Polyangia bacterium]
MKSFALVLFAVSILVGCASLRSEGSVVFRVECNVPDAAVLLDDVPMGRASQWTKPDRFIRPGFYRVEIRHPSYYSHFEEITVADGGSALVKADLHPLLE